MRCAFDDCSRQESEFQFSLPQAKQHDLGNGTNTSYHSQLTTRMSDSLTGQLVDKGSELISASRSALQLPAHWANGALQCSLAAAFGRFLMAGNNPDARFFPIFLSASDTSAMSHKPWNR